MKAFGLAMILLAASVAACTEKADAQSAQTPARAEGAPYVLAGTQVWTVPDPVSGRDYEVFVSLPASYETSPGRRYPVLYVTDADYAFPIIRQIARRVNLDGPVIEEFILVGLSYARGDNPVASRNRDYTPTSYGALLGAQVLFTDPALFHGYVLGSPSFWFDRRHIMTMEAEYARTHRDLPAEVFMYIGAYETPGPGPRHTTDADMVGDVRTMERTLKSRAYPGLRVQSAVLGDEDHLTVAPVGFTRALMALLPAQT